MKFVKKLRLVILGLILTGTMLLHYLHINSSAGFPSAHAVCPLGGLENLWAWIGGRANLQKLFSGTMTLFFFTVIFALVFGRAFCGNICPLGALQEFFGKITKKKFTVPGKTDKYLRYAKYLILVFVTGMAWLTATIWISPYDPYTALAHIWGGPRQIVESGIIGFIILLIILAASVFTDRFFCKYLCPAGALYGILAKAAPAEIRRNKDCISCGQCSKACPMNINVSRIEKVKSAECIACGQCVAVCPSKNNDIRITFLGKTIKPVLFTACTVLLFFVSIAAFDRIGWFKVTPPSLEAVMESGSYMKIADLHGYVSIAEGAALTGTELSKFYEIMEIPLTVPKETPMRDIRSLVPGYDFHVMKANK